jgi:hypothetical protein
MISPRSGHRGGANGLSRATPPERPRGGFPASAGTALAGERVRVAGLTATAKRHPTATGGEQFKFVVDAPSAGAGQ